MKFLISFLFLLSYGYQAVSEEAQNSSQVEIGINFSEGSKYVKNGTGQDLAGADLSEYKLIGDFSNTDFSGANLRGADFSEVTSFVGTNFSGVDLRDADSSWKVFTRIKAAFGNKRFSGDLSNVNFKGANLFRLNSNFQKSLL